MFARLPQALLLSAAAMLGTPAVRAGAPDREARPVSLEAWVKTVNARVSQAMDGPAGVEGIATAYVRRAEGGAVTVVRIAPASTQLTEAARTTLSRIRKVPPMPAGIDPHHLVRVDILFGGGTERSYQTRRQAMIAAASDANRKLAKRLEERSIALSRVP